MCQVVLNPGAGTKQTLAIAGTRNRRAARDEDQIALELAEAESRREALEEDLARSDEQDVDEQPRRRR